MNLGWDFILHILQTFHIQTKICFIFHNIFWLLSGSNKLKISKKILTDFIESKKNTI